MENQKNQLIQEWKKSSQSKSKFCQDRGISYHSFNYWLRKQSNTLASKSGKEKHNFLILHSEKKSGAKTFELHYPSGIKLVLPTDIDMAFLKNILL